MSNKLRVVFDVNIYVSALVGPDSDFPLINKVPPTTSNHAMDAFSLAYDGELFELFCSPHILKNSVIALERLGLSPALVEKYMATIVELVYFSGGSVVEPKRQIFEISDHEDNYVFDLVKAVDAWVLVTSDRELLNFSPWNGRLIMAPRDFVLRSIGMGRKIGQP